ncbi:MAG TPA: SHOCT domain-containing protein [Anaerolineales bacterium]|nr:SHOCT domain-containing protein [Anaerolineales bacterium]
MMTGFGFMGIFGLLLMVLFWGGLIALAVWLVTALSRNGQRASQPPAGGGSTPLEILGQRYARGEIGRDEYEQMKSDLR